MAETPLQRAKTQIVELRADLRHANDKHQSLERALNVCRGELAEAKRDTVEEAQRRRRAVIDYSRDLAALRAETAKWQALYNQFYGQVQILRALAFPAAPEPPAPKPADDAGVSQ
jgi:chromosome segregation ATPase